MKILFFCVLRKRELELNMLEEFLISYFFAWEKFIAMIRTNFVYDILKFYHNIDYCFWNWAWWRRSFCVKYWKIILFIQLLSEHLQLNFFEFNFHFISHQNEKKFHHDGYNHFYFQHGDRNVITIIQAKRVCVFEWVNETENWRESSHNPKMWTLWIK